MNKAGETSKILYSMPSYSLRFQPDIIHFLDQTTQLIEIYQKDDPRFFIRCVQSLEISLYDKIIELNGSKRRSTHWSKGYMKCIELSKKIIMAMNSIEQRESLLYNVNITNYEHYFGNKPKATYKVLITPIPEFED